MWDYETEREIAAGQDNSDLLTEQEARWAQEARDAEVSDEQVEDEADRLDRWRQRGE